MATQIEDGWLVGWLNGWLGWVFAWRRYMTQRRYMTTIYAKTFVIVQ